MAPFGLVHQRYQLVLAAEAVAAFMTTLSQPFVVGESRSLVGVISAHDILRWHQRSEIT